MKVLIGIVVAVVIAILGALILAPDQGNDSVPVAVDTSNQLTGSGYLGDLLDGSRSLVCNYATTDELGVTNEGTLYFDAENERFQVRNQMQDESGVYNSGVINDGTTVYTWAENPEGIFAFQVPAEVEGEEPFPAPPETSLGEDGVPTEDGAFGSEVEYECVDWEVNDEVFVPPSNVTFQNPQELFEAMLRESDAMPTQ